MARTVSEFDLQKAFCIWLDGNLHPQTGIPRTTPALANGVVYFHVPNGGARSPIEGKRFKETGVKAGIHDLLFLRPTQFSEGVFGLLYGMEWKVPDGKPPEESLNPAQKLMHPRLMAAGMAASITVDNLADARAFAIRHGLALPSV